MRKSFAKGDGSTSCRFLEGVGVLGEDKSRRNGIMQVNAVLHQQILALVQPKPVETTNSVELPKEGGNDGD